MGNLPDRERGGAKTFALFAFPITHDHGHVVELCRRRRGLVGLSPAIVPDAFRDTGTKNENQTEGGREDTLHEKKTPTTWYSRASSNSGRRNRNGLCGRR